jgi:hypothetical protein
MSLQHLDYVQRLTRVWAVIDPNQYRNLIRVHSLLSAAPYTSRIDILSANQDKYTMASMIHQLVLHPGITASLKVGSTTVGRDKLYRTVQYFARFLSWYCLRKGYTTETVARLSALKSSLGLSRKCKFSLCRSLSSPSSPFATSISISIARSPIFHLTTDSMTLVEKN